MNFYIEFIEFAVGHEFSINTDLRSKLMGSFTQIYPNEDKIVSINAILNHPIGNTVLTPNEYQKLIDSGIVPAYHENTNMIQINVESLVPAKVSGPKSGKK